MTLGSFGMILLLSRAGFEAEELDDFKGLNRKSPWYAFMMLVIMFSLAGIPPTVGFFAKLVGAAGGAGRRATARWSSSRCCFAWSARSTTCAS